MGLTFNGVHSKDIPGLRIKSIKKPLLPPVEDRFKKITGRPGVYDFGFDFGERRFKVSAIVVAKTPEEQTQFYQAIADWLLVDEPKLLIFDNEPNMSYMARLTGTTDIEETWILGQFEFEFVCPDPMKVQIEPTIIERTVSPGSTITLDNLGNQPTKPIIKVINTNSPPSNLVANPGFETDTGGWTFQNTGGSSGSLSRDMTTFRSGSASGKLNKAGVTGIPRIYFTISNYTAGQQFNFEAWVHSEVANGLTIYAEEETPDWQYPQVSGVMTNGVMVNQWVKVSGVITPTATGGTVYVFFEAREATAYLSWIDDVKVTDASIVTAISKPKIQFGDKFLYYDGDLQSGDELVFDNKEWTAKLNGVSVLDKFDGDFFELPRGQSRITYDSLSGNAKIVSEIQGRWL